MIVRSAPSPTGNGPVVGGGAVRASRLRRAGHPAGVHSQPSGRAQAQAAEKLARTKSHPAQPSPLASEAHPSSGTPNFTLPCEDPTGTATIEQLVGEREPSLEKLLLERDPWPALYTPLFAVLEDNIRGLVHDWNGRLVQ